MLTAIKNMVRADPALRWVLLGGLIIQLITSITATGVSSADQHFQIVEFSLYQLGRESGATYVWEIDHFVRPTLQVYLFSAYHLACNFTGVTDPYVQLTILRIVLGLVMFAVFNALAVHYFKNESRSLLRKVLLLMSFTWVLPYTRTLYSSEMVSSLFLFGAFLIYVRNKDKLRQGWRLVMIGLLFSLAFYFRFQVGFALAGFGLWILFVEKKYGHLVPMAAGFAAGILLNVYLDYRFYHEWVFTPYTYFYANINDGRAALFGSSSFLRYIGLLLLVMPAPPFSIVLFISSLKAFLRQYRNPVFLAVVLFVVAHCLVGHKEERFLFPVFNVLPLMIGWVIPGLEQFYAGTARWIKSLLEVLLWITIVLNGLMLTAMTFVPYSQTIRFSEKLKQRFEGEAVVVRCLGQTPFETPSKNPMVFYKNAAPRITLQRVPAIDSLATYARGSYLSATYNDIREHKALLDSLGYRPVMYSSGLLWKTNEWLHSQDINTINEIWALYRKEK